MISHPQPIEMAGEMKRLLRKTDQKVKSLFERLTQSFSRGQMITYDELNTFPILLKTRLSHGIHTKRLPLPPAFGIYLQVDFQKESELGPHRHDCWAHITVERGGVINLSTGKIFREGDELMLRPNTIQNLKSMDHYTVLFILYSRYAPY